MPQHFIKIEIKGESDLPKEKGGYYFFHGINESKLQLLCYCQKTDDFEVLPAFYIGKFDFYLQPFTSDSKAVIMPTEGMIKKEFPIMDYNELNGIKRAVVQSIDAANKDKRTGAKWFRSQVREVELKEIEKQLLDRFGFTEGAVNAENQVKIFSFIDWLKSPENK